MRLKRILTAAAVMVGSVTAVTLVAPQIASAHHSNVTGSATRPCGADAPWSATWSAKSWENNGVKWKSRHRTQQAGSGWTGWTPGSNSWSSEIASNATYGPFTINNIPASVSYVKVEVWSRWANGNEGGGSAQINRPATTTCPAPKPSVSGTAECANGNDGSWQITWKVTRPSGAPSYWRVNNPSSYNPNYPLGYQNVASVSRTQTYAANVASATETVKAQYQQGDAVSSSVTSSSVGRPTGCGHPVCANRIEVEVNAKKYTIPNPASYGRASWAEIWSKAGNNPHRQHTPTPAPGTQITSGRYNQNNQELDISHVDLCPGPDLPCDDIGPIGDECDPCDNYGPIGNTCKPPTISGTAVCATANDGSWQVVWTVTRAPHGGNSWRIDPATNPNYPASYTTNATIQRTQNLAASTANSGTETVRAQYEGVAGLSPQASAGPISRPVNCAVPTITGTAVCATAQDGSWQVTWTVTRPANGANSWRIDPNTNNNYSKSYTTSATIQRTQTFPASTAQSSTETVRAHYETSNLVSPPASANPISRPANCMPPTVAGLVECTTAGDGSWQVTWKVLQPSGSPDPWRVQPGSYSPADPAYPNFGNANEVTRTVVYPQGTATATETVKAEWNGNLVSPAAQTTVNAPGDDCIPNCPYEDGQPGDNNDYQDCNPCPYDNGSGGTPIDDDHPSCVPCPYDDGNGDTNPAPEHPSCVPCPYDDGNPGTNPAPEHPSCVPCPYDDGNPGTNPAPEHPSCVPCPYDPSQSADNPACVPPTTTTEVPEETTTTTDGGDGGDGPEEETTTTTSTTEVAQLPPDGPTTTQLVTPTTVGSGGPILAPELPATGSDTSGQIAVFATALLLAGAAIVAVTRRRKPDMI